MAITNLTKLVDNALGLNDVGIGRLRSTEWAKKYLWELKFVNAISNDQVQNPTPNSPFDEWFPAIDIEENVANLETLTKDVYGTNFSIPLKGSLKTMKITFLDDINHTVFNFMRNWINVEILNNGLYTSTLEKSIKAVQVNQLNNARGMVESTTYAIFPQGSLTRVGSSSSDGQAYSMDFTIAGVLSTTTGESTSPLGDTLTNIAKNLGRSALGGLIGRNLSSLSF